jgi:CHAD domain-containing protein
MRLAGTSCLSHGKTCMTTTSRPRLTRSLLAAPASHTARRLALGLLQATVREHARLTAEDRSIHDFRVAVRRLRSCLRAYRPWLRDTVRGRFYEALKAVATTTNRVREIEVALEWLKAQDELSSEGSAASERLASSWERQHQQASRQVGKRLTSKFTTLTTRLKRRLGWYHVRVAADAPPDQPTARAVVVETIRTHATALSQAGAEVRSAADIAAAHRLRIAGKRLRYLLEPLTRYQGVRPLIAQLTALQDLLGDFHDSHQLLLRIERAHAAGDAGADPGLDELARRARDRAYGCFDRLEREWLGAGLATAATEANGVAGRIDRKRGRARTPGPRYSSLTA